MDSKYKLFHPSKKHVKIQHLCTIIPQVFSKKRLILLPFYHFPFLCLAEIHTGNRSPTTYSYECYTVCYELLPGISGKGLVISES